jgi:hypothetical protein
MTISNEQLELMEQQHVKRVLSDILLSRIPRDEEDEADSEAEHCEEVLNFLSQEIYDNRNDVLTSSKNLSETIGEYLLSYECCSDDKDVLFVCEMILEDLEDFLANNGENEDDDEGYNSDKDYGDGDCVLCERQMPLTFHHLIPRTTHKKMMRRGYEKKDLNHGIMVCRPCHNAIHRFINVESMALEYNTLEKLLEHEKVQSWIPYVAKQKAISKQEAALYHGGKLRYKS